MKTYGIGGIAPPFLTSSLDGGEWSASLLCRFTPGERAPDIHWIEAGWAIEREQEQAVIYMWLLQLSFY
jgi:hypothetical protein